MNTDNMTLSSDHASNHKAIHGNNRAMYAGQTRIDTEDVTTGNLSSTLDRAVTEIIIQEVITLYKLYLRELEQTCWQPIRF